MVVCLLYGVQVSRARHLAEADPVYILREAGSVRRVVPGCINSLELGTLWAGGSGAIMCMVMGSCTATIYVPLYVLDHTAQHL